MQGPIQASIEFEPQEDQHGPLPRPGLSGQLDRFIGPGATAAEMVLQFVPAVTAAIAAPAYAMTLPIEWSPLQLGLISVLGFDFVGGVLTNATAAAKRWYHRPSQGWQQHLSFVVLHMVHVGLVALLFRGGDWYFLVSVSGYLLGASALILSCPLYLQRPVALGLYVVALLCDRYCLAATPGLEWFLPLLFLKLLVSHLLHETPYRPGEKL
ncbi:hypothetical protein [Acaryochloris marina]|uniref:Uncharacterized protein n=1 Tax=Acaryochloris marina (strain MBIC 11017) TaxID=329726 RepID=B0C3V7_ACAM1|nr:hypothetical protein [Acaryochloris marina]ABW31044.1 conserved hypothetical protein [Acaryochloris marina MBIC11017]BDM79765.1 hypothetical protein AM10699_26330 [Acaryochloris marina MBIC10699]